MVFEILDDSNIEKTIELLEQNGIEFKARKSAYVMALEQDIIGIWDCTGHDEDIPAEILRKALNEIIRDDNAYEEYDYRVLKHLEEIEKEYYKK